MVMRMNGTCNAYYQGQWHSASLVSKEVISNITMYDILIGTKKVSVYDRDINIPDEVATVIEGRWDKADRMLKSMMKGE